MLEEIINNPALEKYIANYDTGQILFIEGDDSQDLYILVSGHLDILKGSKRINHIAEEGELFGEMSFLLGARRSGTARAMSDLKVIRIPKEQINHFLHEFPDMARNISRVLAQRLAETSQIVYGLEEFCDQIPDAVILTDQDCKILMLNNSAEKLYGRDWHEMRHKSVLEIYEEPDVYQQFLKEVESRQAVREKTLKINHPEKETCFISTSTTLLYDAQHNCQGVLSLGRDVTAVKNLEKKYRRTRNWLIPVIFLLILCGAALFFGYPYFSKGVHTVDIQKQSLRNQMAKDYLMLKSLIVDHIPSKDSSQINKVMRDFLNIQKTSAPPYHGLVLLDKEKKVITAHSLKDDFQKMIGSSYAGIEFKGDDDSMHRVLILYRPTKTNPMGQRGIEVAFEIHKAGQLLGWIVFPMDMDILGQEYEIEETDLRKFQFDKP
ncbi:MAG: cyclic nucleotide-binding domain-containing protein [Deltaproteobacteria bacterium]|nr:cyclic nucleotide-binding domain-containing protein [Deltaproteobacteria bacterium]